MSFLSMRLSVIRKDKDCRFDSALRLFKKYKGFCDDIWFSSDYGYPKMETVRETAEQMAIAAEAVRKEGLTASLQISNTLGHGDYNSVLDYSGITWQHVVGHDGTVAPHCNCPRDKDFLAYVREYSVLNAAWKPDVVWIDDDLRMNNHHPADWGCFCDQCLSAFSEENGKNWIRDALAQALNSDESGQLRKSWTEFNSQSLCIVLETIMDAVLSVSPDSRFGVQSASPEYLIYSGGTVLEDMARAVLKRTGKKMHSRPGGGYYCDDEPMGMIHKALIINQTVEKLDGLVDQIPPEIESYPHTASHKTSQGLASEAMLYLAYGCDSLSYATIMQENESVEYFEDSIEYLEKWVPIWKNFVKHNKDSSVGGICIYYNGGQVPAKDLEDFKWAKERLTRIYRLAAAGIPLTFSRKNPIAVLLHEDMANVISEDELKQMLKSGVITSAKAVEILTSRGFGMHLGVTVYKMNEPDYIVQFTEDELNGQFAGGLWINTAPPASRTDYRVESSNPSTRVLSRYIHNNGRAQIGFEGLITETPDKGRLAVLGYDVWQPVLSTARRNQMLATIDWLSNKKIPVRIETMGRMAAVPRVTADGKLTSVTVINASIATTKNTDLVLRNPMGQKAVFITQDASVEIPMELRGGEIHADLPPIPPWAVGVLEIK